MRSAGGAGSGVVALGTIVNTHGIRGEMRLLPHNPDTTALRSGTEAVLVRNGVEDRVQVTAVRRHKRFLLVMFRGVSSVEAAEKLVGSELCIARGALPPLSRGEVYHFELIGLTVVTVAGERVGTVREVMSTAANDICVVSDGDREILIPFIADVVKEVDTAVGRLVIEPLPGLLEA